MLRADALSAFMVIVIGVIALLATLQGVRYLEAEIAAERCTPRHASLYAVLIQGFLATMLLAVLAANLGVHVGRRRGDDDRDRRSSSGIATRAGRWRPRGSTS